MEFEVIFGLILGSFVIVITFFQVIIPIILGKPMFPSFRSDKSRRKSITELEEDLRIADEELRRVRLQHEIEKKKAEAFKLSLDLMMPTENGTSDFRNKTENEKPISQSDPRPTTE